MLRRILILAVVIALAPGCSTIKGWMGGGPKKVKANEPAELTDLRSGIAIRQLWSHGLGNGEDRLWLRQRPALSGNRIYAVNDRGEVLAFDSASGKEIWASNAVETHSSGSKLKFWKREPSEAALTGSPGVGNGTVVVGGRNGEVVAFNADTGEKRWSVRVTSEVLSAPLVTDNRVVVRSNDGRVFGLDLADGSRKWVFDRGLPTLSVRGNASPVGANGLAYIGYDDGTVVALREEDGLRVWEQIVAEPEGRTELDRMADIDGELVVDGDQLFAASYHDKVMALSATSGQPLWTHDVGSYAGVAVTADKVLVSDKVGNLWALDRTTGNSMWKQNLLGNRQLTSPAVQNGYGVVGDFDGYLHWFKLDSGEIVGRERIDRAAVRGTSQVSAEGVLYALSSEGKLAAYQLGN